MSAEQAVPGHRRLRVHRLLGRPPAARRGLRRRRPTTSAAATTGCGSCSTTPSSRRSTRCAATSPTSRSCAARWRSAGITHVIHLAALQVPFVRADPPLGARVNVVGTVIVFEAVRALAPLAGHAHLRLLDRGLRSARAGPRARAARRPATLYGVFKRANEETAGVYWADHGIAEHRPAAAHRVRARPRPGRDLGADQGDARRRRRHVVPDPLRRARRAAARARRGAPVHRRLARRRVEGADGARSARAAGRRWPRWWTRSTRRLPRRRARSASTTSSRSACRSRATRASFVALLGELPTMPLREGVAETIESFRGLLARGLVEARAAA